MTSLKRKIRLRRTGSVVALRPFTVDLWFSKIKADSKKKNRKKFFKDAEKPFILTLKVSSRLRCVNSQMQSINMNRPCKV